MPLLDGRGSLLIAVPRGWQTVSNTTAVVPLVSVGPADGRPFRSSLVVSLERLDVGTDLIGWQRTADQLLAARFERYLLLDLEWVAVGGRAGARRLVTHRVEPALSITTEQWVSVVAETGTTITATTASPLFPIERALFLACLETAEFVTDRGLS